MAQGTSRAEKLEELAARVVEQISDGPDRIAVFLLSNEAMEALREKFRQMPHFKGAEAEKILSEERVDVLSLSSQAGEEFPDPEAEKMLGEVFINIEAVPAAEQQKKLVIHGALHLLGFSHSAKRDKIKMEQKEKELFNLITDKWPELSQD